MRRSTHVIAPLLAASAMTLLAGCRRQEMERCVDESNHVVDPSFCKNLAPGAQQPVAGNPQNNGVPYNNTIVVPHSYRYYYGGGGGWNIGSVANGGSYAPVAGHSYSFSSGTSRGGFGSSFSSEGGGE